MLHKFITFDSIYLLNIRIVFLFCALLHLLVTAVLTLSIDTTIDEDPRVRAYHYIRWKLLTCWFNLITLVYLPSTLYCNWRMKYDDRDKPGVVRLRHITDVVMTGLIFPVTLFADIFFWCMFLTDPSLMGPPKIFYYLPLWSQHSLHTISMFVVIIELVLTPRLRPRSMKPRIALLMTFTTIYTGMVFYNYTKGEFIYAVCDGMSVANFICVYVFSMTVMLILFAIQWAVINFLWGTHYDDEKKIH